MRRLLLAAAALGAVACTRTLDVPEQQQPVLPGSIALSVTQAGKPAPQARARVAAAGATALSDAQGALELGRIPEGVYEIEAASADGSAAVRLTGVTVLAGKQTALGTVALASSGALHGKVTIPGAATNAGALVFIPGRSES